MFEIPVDLNVNRKVKNQLFEVYIWQHYEVFTKSTQMPRTWYSIMERLFLKFKNNHKATAIKVMYNEASRV